MAPAARTTIRLRMALAIAALVAAVSAPPLAAAPAAYRVDPASTVAGFAVTELGFVRREGRFERTSGEIVLDPEQGSGRIDFAIDTRSVRTGWSLRDAFVASGFMLDADAFPMIRFRSTRLAYAAERLVAVDGELTLHGVSRPVQLPVRHLGCAVDAAGREACAAEILLSISRAAFGMPYAYPLVGDTIDIEIALSAFRVPLPGEALPVSGRASP